ncbi:pyruvate kinase [Engelhardtia mirabilis]|uniref:Pyruvate kinase n=1 Tax=Engelhardtia mirabilis TaxID=2528011 RepID=A0A518BQU8_9BACT|nr:Pyruvate kinase [Planctomycetes bacterium Pla133]QDV03678.1 Pyruvate kinase [Planctomycetes bacterium Pla86]
MPERSQSSPERRPKAPHSNTKIVATIGPASEGRIEELILAGMNVARINFSHGEAEEHRRRIDVVRKAARNLNMAVAVLADIQGPKLRMGKFANGPVELVEGDEIVIRQGEGPAQEGEVYFKFDGFLGPMQIGHRLLLADGAVAAEATACEADHIRAVVTRGGVVADRKGVNLPDTDLAVDLPTPKDIADIEVARQCGVDMIGISFVGSAEDVEKIRELAPEPQMVAKIERAIALERLPEIIKASDGIMVARGDLGVETELERLPMLQKMLIQSALREGRYVITATEMLESMIHSSRPTRAEVADVANAVLDGTDAVMLSAETAVGKYPREAIETMVRIAHAVETSDGYNELPRVEFRASEPTFSNAIAVAAVEAAEALGLTKIIAFTETGNTVRLLSRYRPRAEIIALTPHQRTLNLMAMLAHVRPILYGRDRNLEDMMFNASLFLQDKGLVRGGEQVLFVAGVPPGVARTTNLMKLHRIGERVRFH